MNNDSPICTKEPFPYHDERFHKVQDQVREIKGLLREINETVDHKFNVLFGTIAETSPKLTKNKLSDPDSWIDKVIIEQEISLEVCRDILERINSI